MAIRSCRWRRPALRLVLAALSCAAVELFALSSVAAANRVVVVVPPELAACGERVRAELAAMGFRVELAGERAENAAVMPDADVALAELSLSADGRGVELRVMEEAGARLSFQAFLAAPLDEPTLPLRVAELLRASLLEPQEPAREVSVADAALAPAATANDAPPRTPATSAEREQARIGSASVAAAGLKSAGGLPAFPALVLSGTVWFGPRLGVRLGGVLPLAEMSHTAGEGSSRTRVTLISLDARVQLAVLSSRWSLEGALGAAGVRLRSSGQPATPDHSRQSNSALGLAPFAALGVSHALGARLHVGARAQLGLSLPRFLITYGERTAATWGAPFALGELGLEVDLP